MAVSTRGGAETFPLVPRGRLVGVSYGLLRSARRGSGSDVAGSRAYRAGDDVDLIDWAASARLSSALGRDEFVVHELHAEEAPRVIVLADRSPTLALYPEPLPWLRKWLALEEAVRLITASSLAARAFPGYLDYADGEAYWRSPRSGRAAAHEAPRRGFAAPAGSLAAGLVRLAELRPAPPLGTFVFVLSDFLEPPATEAWYEALERGWDLVPVVIQDPVWERSFPDVAGVAVPFVDAAGGRPRLVRPTRGEVETRRAANEARFGALLSGFEDLGADAVVLDSHEPFAVAAAFFAWADDRTALRGRRP